VKPAGGANGHRGRLRGRRHRPGHPPGWSV